jgi:nucleoside-diphosphate-sugar epimerase
VTAVAITGSTGHVGSALADGHDIVALSRRPTDPFQWRRYELGRPLAPDLLRDVDVVVHCAYDLSLTKPGAISRVNVDGTLRLVEAATAVGAGFVLISSMSAYPGTRQIYGRAKLATEKIVLAAGGQAVRLGLVYGDDGKGMIGTLQRLVALPVTPVIGRNAHQFTVHVDDMAHGVLRLALGAERPLEAVGLAHPVPVRFDDLLITLAQRSGTRMRELPVPWPWAYGAMRLAEALHVPLPVRADSVLGLVRPAPFVPYADLWPTLGVHVRAFGDWPLAQRPAATPAEPAGGDTLPSAP